ncbi:MAG: DUF4231 domain-containing protein [Bacteroidota bacterium]
MNNQDEYIKNRVIRQQEWFSTKATTSKKRYYNIIISVIIITSCIPVLSLISELPHNNIIIAFLSAVSAVLTSINLLYDHKNNWLRYRTTSELIKSAHSRFIASGNSDSDFALLVDKIENIILETNSEWQASQNSMDN